MRTNLPQITLAAQSSPCAGGRAGSAGAGIGGSEYKWFLTAMATPPKLWRAVPSMDSLAGAHVLWEQALDSSQALFCSTLLVGVWVSWKHQMSALATSGFLALRLKMMPFVMSPKDEMFWQKMRRYCCFGFTFAFAAGPGRVGSFANSWDLIPRNELMRWPFRVA